MTALTYYTKTHGDAQWLSKETILQLMEEYLTQQTTPTIAAYSKNQNIDTKRSKKPTTKPGIY